MDRRRQNRTDESTTSDLSITDSLKGLVLSTFGEAVGFYIFGDEEQRSARPETILNRMLSTKSAISTHSSLAEVYQRAHDDAASRVFAQIGSGQCGTVFALKGTTSVIKIPNTTAKREELRLDFLTHKRVYDSFAAASQIRENIHIPRAIGWVSPTTTAFWQAKKELFPADVVTPNFGLISEHIFPVPMPVREAIVDALLPKAIKDNKAQFMGKAENKDCLIRIYLGRRKDTRKMDPSSVRLRNFPLHVNEMERLGLDVAAYAKVMAQALAFMHWRAGVDANDVEFVMGSTPEVVGQPTYEQLEECDIYTMADYYKFDFEHRSVGMWLLDFNQCQKFQHSAAGMKKLVEGFWFNDPYYPRPNATSREDQQLWEVFERHYLEVSAELTEDKHGPRDFIQGVVEMGKARAGSLFG